jgi:hypothetical protein
VSSSIIEESPEVSSKKAKISECTTGGRAIKDSADRKTPTNAEKNTTKAQT